MTRTLAAASLLAILSFAAPARAADEASLQEAHVLFNEGVALFERGDFEHARVKFVAASALVKSADILWNLALAEAKSGHKVDALNHFRAYSHEAKARAEDLREAQQKWIPLLEPQVGELAIDGAPGLAVSIDGAGAGTLPLADPVAVAPGAHHVEGHLGVDAVARDVSLRDGQVISVHLAPPAVAKGVAETAPAPPVAVSSAQAPAEPPDTAEAPVSAHGNPLRVWLTVGLGVASAAALGTGIYFAAQSNSEASHAQQIGGGLAPNACVNASAPGCASLTSALASENHDHTAEVGLYVGAGVLAAGALASWLFLPKTVEARSVALPYVAPGVVGAQWATRF